MSGAALARADDLLPRPPGGNGAGALLALAVHGGLLLALTAAVDWRTRTPDVVSAELWASVPQVAAPRAETAAAPVPAPAPPAPAPPPPPPAPAPEPPRATTPPPEPDIALQRAEEQRKRLEEERRRATQEQQRREAEARERREAEAKERREAAERERREAAEKQRREAAEKERREAAEKQRREAAEKQRREAAARKAEDERLARLREEQLRRMMGQAGATAGTGGSGTAATSAAPSASYAGLVVARIRPNIVYTGNPSDNAAAEVEVRAAPGGTIIARRLVKSSGHPDWDQAVLRAIDRTEALPRDRDGRVPSTLIISFRPRD